MSLRERWEALAGTSAAAAALYDDVVARYAEPHRRYHTLRHVEHVLEVADVLSDGVATEAVRWAAWLHDVVYDTRAADSEERSAAFARERLPALGVAGATVEEVARLVLATKTHVAGTAGAMVLLDADLAILAADERTYDAYAAAVREEYGWVPDDTWVAGRRRVLTTFFDRPAIFSTERMRAEAEPFARANLARELASLGGAP